MLGAARMRYAPLMAFQLLLVVLFAVFGRYAGGEHADIRGFEGTHVMIFAGFGFLMTFLRRYCYSALGLTLLLGALLVQWALLVQGAMHMDLAAPTIPISKKSLLEADIMAATVLISFGAVLGALTGAQLVFVAVLETVLASFNLWLISDVFQAADVGGSIGIHAFGAYYGLGLSAALRVRKRRVPAPPPVQRPDGAGTPPGQRRDGASTPPVHHCDGGSPPPRQRRDGASTPPGQRRVGAISTITAVQTTAIDLNGPTYFSDVTAMIGTIFLWVYWPSFNSALTSSDAEYERALVNTYLSLAAATVTTFFASTAVSHRAGRLDMVHVQNATLAGGVAVGAVANLQIGAGGAAALGVAAGLLSVLGYRFLTPALQRLGVRDTCGVHNLHGLPGVLSGALAAALAALASSDLYGAAGLAAIYPAMKDGGRSAAQQGLQQLLALAVTLAVAGLSGLLTGLLTRLKVFRQLKTTEKYDDEPFWELPPP